MSIGNIGFSVQKIEPRSDGYSSSKEKKALDEYSSFQNPQNEVEKENAFSAIAFELDKLHQRLNDLQQYPRSGVFANGNLYSPGVAGDQILLDNQYGSDLIQQDFNRFQKITVNGTIWTPPRTDTLVELILVGGGGGGGNASANGGDGGDTSVLTYTASGGKGANNINGGDGGVGGDAGTNTSASYTSGSAGKGQFMAGRPGIWDTATYSSTHPGSGFRAIDVMNTRPHYIDQAAGAKSFLRGVVGCGGTYLNIPYYNNLISYHGSGGQGAIPGSVYGGGGSGDIVIVTLRVSDAFIISIGGGGGGAGNGYDGGDGAPGGGGGGGSDTNNGSNASVNTGGWGGSSPSSGGPGGGAGLKTAGGGPGTGKAGEVGIGSKGGDADGSNNGAGGGCDGPGGGFLNPDHTGAHGGWSGCVIIRWNA